MVQKGQSQGRAAFRPSRHEALGKLTYERMSAATEVSQDAQGADQDIARSMTDISALLAEIEALQKRSDEA